MGIGLNNRCLKRTPYYAEEYSDQASHAALERVWSNHRIRDTNAHPDRIGNLLRYIFELVFSVYLLTILQQYS